VIRSKNFSTWEAAVVAVALAGVSACGSQRSALAPEPPPPAPVTAAQKVEHPPASAASEEPAGSDGAPAAASTEGLTRDVPGGCDAGSPNCTPPRAFAQKVCSSKYPELALYLFSRGTPWQRLYVKAERVEPVNTYDGERSDRWLAFGEEVIVLWEHGSGASQKVVVSGPTDVDVLRWDGTCATIRKEMLVSYVPAPMDSVRIIWRYLDADVQQTLLGDELVVRAQDAERKNCKGSSVKHPSEVCEKAMKRLTDVIVLALKRDKGVVLAAPEARPAWRP
jgi:hypothetical protein